MIFDLNITWASLRLHPVSRMVEGGTILVYVTPPDEINNAIDLINHWGLQLTTSIIVRGHDAREYIGLVATYGKAELPQFSEKLGVIPTLSVNALCNKMGVGVALFTSLVPSGWDWWEPDNIRSTTDLWDYPFRPRNFTVNEHVAKYAALLREKFIAMNALMWEIGDLLVEIDRAGHKWRAIYKAVGLPSTTYNHRWGWDLMKIAAMFPEPIRNYTFPFTEYRNQLKKANTKK